MSAEEQRAGVELTNLDQPLSPDADATKRDLVDYLDAVADRILPGLAGRPLTVLRVLRGRAPFMQKNVPKYTPDWVRTVPIWAEASKREVRYALCDDRRTLLWLANQRAVEYHPTLGLADDIYRPTHLVLDLDPPAGRRLRRGGRRRTSRAAGARGLRPGRRGEDQRRQGCARVRARSTTAPRSTTSPRRPARSPPAPRHSIPTVATTAFIVEDRDGKVFVDSTRAGGATVAPPTVPGCDRARRCRSRWTGPTSTGSPRPTSRCTRRSTRSAGGDPWAESMPAPQRLPTGSDRARPHHPRRPGGGDARGQAPGKGAARSR